MTIVAPQLIVLATLASEDAGRREATRAARLLGYPIAVDTMTAVPRRRHYVGAVITLQRRASGEIVVASYLGDQRGIDEPLWAARKHFPRAIAIPVVLPSDPKEPWDHAFYVTDILVVASDRSYQSAVRAAKRFATASGIPYGSRGMRYDKKRGLVWPDAIEDETYAGQYAPRRYDLECGGNRCVTVERSEAYEGFRPGLYIVVAGILERGGDREERIRAARRIVPTAYARQTTLYLGCMH